MHEQNDVEADANTDIHVDTNTGVNADRDTERSLESYYGHCLHQVQIKVQI